MENEYNETMTETNENIDDFYTEEEEASSGIIGKVILGGAALATGVAGGFIFKNRDKIKGKVSEIKEKKAAKKLEKARAKVAKLEAKQAQPEAEKEE